MATNWNEVLSNTNNLNDVLSILKKVLAGLEVKADSTTINEALQDIEGLKVDIGAEVENVNTALDQFQTQADEVIAQGFYKGFATETALKASLPTVSEMRARADDTRKIWRWNRTSIEGVVPVTGTWTDTGLSDLDQSKNYTDTKVDSIGIEQGMNTEISVAIVDSEENRTWLEADGAGKPTDYSKSLILEVIDSDLAEKVQQEVEQSGIGQMNISEISVAIVDSEENRTWLEADGAGKPTPYSSECISSAIGISGKVSSGPNITCWGDSMTADVYPSVLKTLLQNSGMFVDVYNMGIGGETSVTICARQGGNPFRILVDNGVIPPDASAVRVTLLPINGEVVRPLLQGPSAWSGYLGDVHGNLSRVTPDDYYIFTRTTVGATVTLDRPAAFYLDIAKPRLVDIHIIWIGQNGPSNTRAISDAKAMIQNMKALNKRFLVISKPTSSDADDAAWFSEFGSRFVAARKYLIQYGLQDANITPTAQDLTDISNGVVPSSLRKDAVHWTPTGYSILANIILKRLKEMGWI